MRNRGVEMWIAGLTSIAAFLTGGCGGEEGGAGEKGSLQSSCVSNQLDLERAIPDGQGCDNWGYSDCYGFASECVNYCAHEFCQPESCETAKDCEGFFGTPQAGLGWVCTDYVVSSRSYGTWCDLDEVCVEGTINCPCAPGDVCGPDPFGSGNMRCVAVTWESTCPSACIVGSVCCGGAFCSGNCIGTPCCS